MEHKITTIRLKESTKIDLRSLEEHERETDEQLLLRLIRYVKDKENLKGGDN